MEQLHVHVYIYIHLYAYMRVYIYIHIHTYIYIFMYLFIHLSICRYRRDFSKGMALAFGGMLVVSEECRAFWGLPKLKAIYTASCSRKCCVLFTEMLRSFRHVFLHTATLHSLAGTLLPMRMICWEIISKECVAPFKGRNWTVLKQYVLHMATDFSWRTAVCQRTEFER